jgi:hypothetical protein
MENDRWTAYKNGIATGDKYQKRLDDYFEFCEEEELPSSKGKEKTVSKIAFVRSICQSLVITTKCELH